MSERMFGADIDQLRTLATLFDDRSQALRSAVDLVGGSVDQVPWFGPSSEMFRDEWADQHAPALRDAATALQTSAERLRTNADDQEATSNDLAGGTGPGGGPGTGPGSGPGTGPGPVPPGDGTSTSDDNWADRLIDIVDVIGWGGSAGTVAEFGAELLSRASAGAWGLADAFPGSGAFGVAGQALGWLGVATGGWMMGQGIAEGDWWKVGDGAITAGLGVGAVLAGAALVSNPVGWAILGAGAAWAVADLLIDGNITETVANGIADGAAWAWDAGGDVLDGAGEIASDVWDAGGDLLEGAGDLAEDLWPF
jgi:uncharacterized protein YukE